MNIDIPDEKALETLAGRLISHCQLPCVMYLQGELGVGKTTFARKLLRALNHEGAIKSPTYTLIESYETKIGAVHHLDLYRIKDPGELEFLGLQELLHHPAIWLIEWPEQGGALLPAVDLRVEFRFTDGGRALTLTAKTPAGEALLERI